MDSRFHLAAVTAVLALVLFVALRLYRRMRHDRLVRIEAERAAAQASRCAELIGALAHARTPDAAIESILQEPLHALRADAGMVFLVSRDGSQADVARAVGYGAAVPAPTIQLAEKGTVADAVGRGAAVIIESPPARVVVPVLIGSRVVAVAQLDFRTARTFDGGDREYIETLGIRAAQALDRTWQYEFAVRARGEAETQRARADQEILERQKVEVALRASEARGRALAARTSRLHALTAALSEAVTVEDVGRAVVHQGLIAAGATAGEVTLLAEDGAAFHSLYAQGAGLVAGQRLVVEPGLCAEAAVASRAPVFVSSFEEWQERFPKSASLAADGGYVSSATMPLLAQGTAIGVVAFYFTAPVKFDPEYGALLVSIAQHCAQALDRARLYDAAEQARADAEGANRLKDEFVSIVSHELRSPLNAILGWSAMLLEKEMDPALTGRALQSVHENATRQSRLIEELLDFSRVASGRLALVREEIEVRDLLRGVVESQIPQAVAKGVTLELAPVPATKVSGDLRRLEQVFFNLIGNSLKFTPTGGKISLTVATVNGEVEVRVADTGIGIEPDVLPYIFDRFRQASDASAREYGGLGLGLSIARQLVEAHDGTIAVDSAGAGHGATFIVRLPVA